MKDQKHTCYVQQGVKVGKYLLKIPTQESKHTVCKINMEAYHLSNQDGEAYRSTPPPPQTVVRTGPNLIKI